MDVEVCMMTYCEKKSYHSEAIPRDCIKNFSNLFSPPVAVKFDLRVWTTVLPDIRVKG